MGQTAYSIAMKKMGELIEKANLNQEAVDAALAPINAQLADLAYNVKSEPYGAKGNGTTDDSTAFQDAIDAAYGNGGGKVYIPPGTYKITSKLLLNTGVSLIGAGADVSIIKSYIVGDSLIKTTDMSFVYISDIQLKGSAIEGSSGNGHAINFIDPSIDSGTHSPQNCYIERVYIRDFKGFDHIDNDTDLIESCGIIQNDGLQNVYRDVNIYNCGHGVYLSEVQNTKLDNCVISDCMKYGVISYRGQNVVIDKCDIIDCGDGTESSGYPESPWYTGNVFSTRNENFVLSSSKLKNTSGKAQFVSIYSNNDIIQNNWIRATYKGIYAERCPGIRILGNTFSPANDGTSNKFEQIELYHTLTTEPFSTTIENNVFEEVGGQGTAYNIKIGGSNSTRLFTNLNICKNNFGWRDAAASAVTVDVDILITSCTIKNSIIEGNLHNAPSNVTRTAGLAATGTIVQSNNRIGKNGFVTNGGTITANYTGVITESTLTGTATYDPSSLTDGSSITTNVTVTGALLGDLAIASFSLNTSGVDITAWVSASNTVSVKFSNRTGSTVDLASGTLKAVVTK